MATEIRVPTLGESVTEATIGQWFKKVGDAVAADEPVVELETDKVTIEVPAPVRRRARGDRRQAGRDGQCRRAARRDRRRAPRRRAPKPAAAKPAEAPKPRSPSQAADSPAPAPAPALNGNGARLPPAPVGRRS